MPRSVTPTKVRSVAALGGAYGLLCAVCVSAPTSRVRAMLDALWLLGPPANLVHGTSFLVAFLIGTVLVLGLSLALARARRRGLRVVLGLVLLLIWVSSGWLAYAPGA